MRGIEENLNQASGSVGTAIVDKFNRVFQRNPGWKEMASIAEILEGQTTSLPEVKLSPAEIACPMTSCEVERTKGSAKCRDAGRRLTIPALLCFLINFSLPRFIGARRLERDWNSESQNKECCLTGRNGGEGGEMSKPSSKSLCCSFLLLRHWIFFCVALPCPDGNESEWEGSSWIREEIDVAMVRVSFDRKEVGSPDVFERNGGKEVVMAAKMCLSARRGQPECFTKVMEGKTFFSTPEEILRELQCLQEESDNELDDHLDETCSETNDDILHNHDNVDNIFDSEEVCLKLSPHEIGAESPT
uniref:Uncharacterized protein n=1 Tax=Timema monikensis TaxID=170555 RepID=A0A7R9E6X9_9NEOP|nr:unnamed protein product [Timema monikensis]